MTEHMDSLQSSSATEARRWERWMDHDDEHAPVRHEITTEPCGQCGLSYPRGEMQALDNGRGDRWLRCYRCKASSDKRYLEAIGAVDPLMARYLDGDR